MKAARKQVKATSKLLGTMLSLIKRIYRNDVAIKMVVIGDILSYPHTIQLNTISLQTLIMLFCVHFNVFCVALALRRSISGVVLRRKEEAWTPQDLGRAAPCPGQSSVRVPEFSAGSHSVMRSGDTEGCYFKPNKCHSREHFCSPPKYKRNYNQFQSIKFYKKYFEHHAPIFI